MNKFYTLLLLLGLLLTGCGQSSEQEEYKEQNKPLEVKEYIKEVQKIELDQNKSDNINPVEVQNTPLEESTKDVNVDKSLPFSPPTGRNIVDDVFDSSFETLSSNYFLDNETSFDTTLKRSGKRSIRLSELNDAINIENIPVKEGSWYIFTGYMYVNSLPSDVVRFYTGYTNNGEHIRSLNYTVISVSTPNKWEEFIVPIYIQKDKNVKDLKFIIRNIGKPDTNMTPISDVWIDDIGLYEVKDSTRLFGFTKPLAKKPFEGSHVRVDSLGNIEVKSENGFEPFFPIIIYPNGYPTKWIKYKENGFNTIICNNPDEAKFAVNDGMNWIWDLQDYGVDDRSASGYNRFISEYQSIKKNNPMLLDKLLYFYWDNEKYLIFDSLKIFSEKIQEMDVDKNGKRLRPIYMHLDFTTGNKNYHNSEYQLIDIQGSYANPLLYQNNDFFSYPYELAGHYNAEFSNFSVFENIPNVTTPKSIFVLDSPQDDYFENTIFAAIARGGRGMSYWRDSGSQPTIESRTWWSNFLNITNKIKKLQPLIQTPHWTKWELEYTLKDDEDGIVVGTRDYETKRCMIVASRSNKQEKVTFTTKGKKIGNIYDFFSGTSVAKGDGDSFTLTFTPHQSGVYCWN